MRDAYVTAIAAVFSLQSNAYGAMSSAPFTEPVKSLMLCDGKGPYKYNPLGNHKPDHIEFFDCASEKSYTYNCTQLASAWTITNRYEEYKDSAQEYARGMANHCPGYNLK